MNILFACHPLITKTTRSWLKMHNLLIRTNKLPPTINYFDITIKVPHVDVQWGWCLIKQKKRRVVMNAHYRAINNKQLAQKALESLVSDYFRISSNVPIIFNLIYNLYNLQERLISLNWLSHAMIAIFFKKDHFLNETLSFTYTFLELYIHITCIFLVKKF